MSKIKMISIILGGGTGSRLYPLTADRSKPAVPVGGKYRLIDIPISNCLNSGLKRMFVLTQFNSASLNSHISKTYQFDRFSYGFVDVLAAEQTRSNTDWFQGTADAVRQCMHHLVNHEFDYVLILAGDQLYQMDFEEMAKTHIEAEADITIATLPVDARDATGFGIMKVSDDGFIRSFVEKPSTEELPKWVSPVSKALKRKGRIYQASMGIYIFSKKAIEQLFEENKTAVDFGKEIIPNAIQTNYKVASYNFDGYWADIGTIRSFFESNIAFTDNLPDFNFFDDKDMIYTRARMLAPTRVFGTRFNKSIIADGCFIHAKKIERAIIGIRSRIGKKVELNHVIVFGADYYEKLEEILVKKKEGGIPIGIGDGTKIENAIIDKNSRIGQNVVIKGNPGLSHEMIETDTYCIRDGIVVVKKNAVIENDSVIIAKEEVEALTAKA